MLFPVLLVAGGAWADPTTRPASELRPPLPVWPSDTETIVEKRPVFRMNGRFGATHYRVEVARTADFKDPISITQFKVLETGGIAPVVAARFEGEPLADGRYYWRAFCAGESGDWTPPANYRAFTIAPVNADAIVASKESAHPRLLISEGELASANLRISRSEYLRRGWQYLNNSALGLLEATPPDEKYAKSGAGQHGNYGQAALWYHQHLENMALAACLTGDERFTKKAVEFLMAACAYDRWLGPLFDRPDHFDPPWHASLETAMMTEAVALGYDLLYPRLTDDQRKQVRRALVEKGIRPLVHDWVDPVTASRIPRHQLPTGNWVMVCSGAAGVGALAVLGEEPQAGEWARLVRTRVRAWLHDRGGDYCVDRPYPQGRPSPMPVVGPTEPNFGPDGGYKESIVYMDYAMRYVCYFADALRRQTGDDFFEEFPPNLLDHVSWAALAWPEPSAGGSGRDPVRIGMLDFGDTGLQPDYGDLYAALTKNRQDGRAAWLSQHLVPMPTCARQLLWYDESIVPAAPSAPVPLHTFRDIGQVICRRGWSPSSPAAAIKFHQNRGHLDLGTFEIFGRGQPIVTEAGPAGYLSEVYREFSSQTVGHNVVLVDDLPQERADGTLLAAAGTPNLSLASGELAAAYPQMLSSWTRDLLMLPGGEILVFDKLTGIGSHRFDLLLHPQPPYTFDALGIVKVGERPAADVAVLSDGAFKLGHRDGYIGTTPSGYVCARSLAASEERKFLTVCTWPAEKRPAPPGLMVEEVVRGKWQIQQRSDTRSLEVRIGGADDEHVTCDGRLVAVFIAGKRTKRYEAVFTSAKQLRVEGLELLRSTQPISAALELDVPLRARFWAPAAAQITLAADPQIRELLLNGQSVSGEWNGSALTLDIPAGESELAGFEFARPLQRPASLVFNDLMTVPIPPGAPAIQSGVHATASSFSTDPLQAFDGNANTAWTSLPGKKLPQWLQIDLPQAAAMGQVAIEAAGPCSGHVETLESDGQWHPRGEFEIRRRERVTIRLNAPVTTKARRIVVERLDRRADAATIYCVDFSPAAPASQPAQTMAGAR